MTVDHSGGNSIQWVDQRGARLPDQQSPRSQSSETWGLL